MSKYVCVDFDGTIVAHEYPKIGRDIGAFEWLKLAQDNGAKLILFTMRSGDELGEAVYHCYQNGINFFGINHNPTQDEWTDSPKAYGNIYIDDAALGCPLVFSSKAVRPFVDWRVVGPMLMEFLGTESEEIIMPEGVSTDEIEWFGFDDGYCIVGYSFDCPKCDELNSLAAYYDDEVQCEHCSTVFKNPNQPEM